MRFLARLTFFLLTLLALALPAGAHAAGAQIRVISGTNASSTQFPYQVRLTIRVGASFYQCGGVIRDATHVMTAAHCVVDGGSVAQPSDVTVSYGDANRNNQRAAAVYGVMAAPQYVAGDPTYDAALLTLAAPLVGYGGSTVNAVPLATAAQSAAAVTQGATATVSGWGKTEDGSLATTLRSTNLTLRSDATCVSRYGGTRYAATRYVCAGGTGSASSNNPDSCGGDSGGPLVTTTDQGVRLIGLVSFGPASGCGQPGIPAAYTEVSDPTLNALLTGTTAPAPPASSSAATTAPAPAPAAATRPMPGNGQATGTDPGDGAAAGDPPRASIGVVRCRRHVCVVRVRSRGSKLAASLTRRVTRCRGRACRSTRRRVAGYAPAKSGDGYTVRLRLRPGAYRFSAYASDAAGRRSGTVARSFHVAH